MKIPTKTSIRYYFLVRKLDPSDQKMWRCEPTHNDSVRYYLTQEELERGIAFFNEKAPASIQPLEFKRFQEITTTVEL